MMSIVKETEHGDYQHGITVTTKYCQMRREKMIYTDRLQLGLLVLAFWNPSRLGLIVDREILQPKTLGNRGWIDICRIYG